MDGRRQVLRGILGDGFAVAAMLRLDVGAAGCELGRTEGFGFRDGLGFGLGTNGKVGLRPILPGLVVALGLRHEIEFLVGPRLVELRPVPWLERSARALPPACRLAEAGEIGLAPADRCGRRALAARARCLPSRLRALVPAGGRPVWTLPLGGPAWWRALLACLSRVRAIARAAIARRIALVHGCIACRA